MRIGTINMPGRHKFNGQSIRTRFFILGLPLFPTGCFYQISNNLGINVPLSGQDLLHAYAKIHFGILGLIGLFWMQNTRHHNSSMQSILLILSLALLAFSVYSWLRHSDSKGDELINRKIFGKAFLYNMPPEYLPKNVQQSLFGELLKVYFGKYARLDWQKDIETENVYKHNFALLYTLAYYQKTITPSVNHNALFGKILAYLKKEKKLKTSEPTATQNQTNTSPEKETLLNILQDIQGTNTQAAFQSSSAKDQSAHSSSDNNKHSDTSGTKQQAHKLTSMTAKDVFKVEDAQSRLFKQLFMVFGFFAFGFIVVAIISSDKSLLGNAFLICLVLYGVISAIVFLPSFLKINKDLKERQKMRIKVRIKDLAQEAGTAYLVLQANKYGIKKLTAPAEYYSTELLNKELEIDISKASHTLLEIVRVSY